jgi:hypothetical protein
MLTGYGRENEAAARAVGSENFPVLILESADQAVGVLNGNPVMGF